MEIKSLHNRLLLKVFVWVLLTLITTSKVCAEEENLDNSIIRKAEQTFALVETSQNFVEELKTEYITQMPVGISKTFGNVNVMLAVSKLEDDEVSVTVDFFAKIILPNRSNVEKKTDLFFGAQNLKLSKNGFIGDVRLALLGNVSVPILSDNKAELRIRGGIDADGKALDLSYVDIDCGAAIKHFGLATSIVFSDGFIFPVDSVNNKIPNAKIEFPIELKGEDFNNILLRFEGLPRFGIKGLNGFGFVCKDLIFDFSDTQTAESFVLPEGYEVYQPYSTINNWRGFFAKEISVSLPPQFKDETKTYPPSFNAQNMLIDDYGVTGLFSVRDFDLIKLANGNASGWNFSLDQFEIDLMANTLVGAGFGGLITVPVGENKEKNTLRYEGAFDGDGNYLMSVILTEDKKMTFDMLKAEATIYKNSYVKIAVEDKQFRPEAMLHGKMSVKINGSKEDKPKADMGGIKFQSLHIMTKEPYLEAKYFGYQGKASISGVPISLKELALVKGTKKGEVGLKIGVDMEFGETISAGTDCTIFTQVEKNSKGRMTLRYDRFFINSIDINADFAEVFAIKGHVEMYENDPIYGDGFGGNLDLKFKKVLDGLGIGVKANFGNCGFDYWEVDASTEFTPGLQCGPITLFGFSGGASMCMKREGSPLDDKAVYKPNKNYGLGFRAGVMAGFLKPELMKVNLVLEVQFNRNWGLNFIGLYGHADVLQSFADGIGQASKAGAFMSKIDAKELEKTNDNPELIKKLASDKAMNPQSTCGDIAKKANTEKVKGLESDLVIQYSFKEKVFHAQLDVNVNFANVLFGPKENYGAGQAVIHFANNDDWYIYVGKPDNPVALKLGIKDLSVKTTSYIMAGNKIPAMKNPPAQVIDILHNEAWFNNREPELFEGKGFAFGSDFNVGTGDLNFLIAYANFSAGVGFDIMLTKTNSVYCKGEKEPIGLNGWYAEGQVYSYLAGELGVQINLGFIKGKFPIIKTGTAAMLKGELPNPSVLSGALALKYELLGGMIKGNMNFKFKVGKGCEFVGKDEPPIDIAILGEISPSGGDVDAFSEPQASFNMAINKDFETKLDDKNTTIKAVLKQFEIKEENGNVVSGEQKWNDESDKVTFIPNDILKPKTNYVINVKVGFKKFVNNQWEIVTYNSGKEYEESKSQSFLTGEMPDSIPFKYVSKMYPVKNQYNFYPQEYGKGFINLSRKMLSMFNAENMEYSIAFVDENGQLVEESNLTYDDRYAKINFEIPTNLPLESEYTLNLIMKPKGDQNVVNEATYDKIETEDSEMEIRKNEADELVNSDAMKILLAYPLRTSKYQTFSDHIRKIHKESSYLKFVYSDVYLLGYNTSAQEPFDFYEIWGNDYTGGEPMVMVVATGEDAYFKKYVKEAYDTCPLFDPPFDEVKYDGLYLDAYTNGDKAYLETSFPLQYRLAIRYYDEIPKMRTWAVNELVKGNRNQAIINLSETFYKPLTPGDYPVRFQYRLPNGKITSRSVDFKFKNELKYK